VGKINKFYCKNCYVCLERSKYVLYRSE